MFIIDATLGGDCGTLNDRRWVIAQRAHQTPSIFCVRVGSNENAVHVDAERLELEPRALFCHFAFLGDVPQDLPDLTGALEPMDVHPVAEPEANFRSTSECPLNPFEIDWMTIHGRIRKIMAVVKHTVYLLV